MMLEHYRAISAGAGAVLVLCAVHFSSQNGKITGNMAADGGNSFSYAAVDCPLDTTAPAAVLAFKHRTGTTSQMLIQTSEDAYFAKHLVNRSEIESNVSIKTVKVYDNGSAALDGTFTVTEHSLSAVARSSLPFAGDAANKVAFTFKREQKNRFGRTAEGKYIPAAHRQSEEPSIAVRDPADDGAFAPVLRSFPVFPQSPIRPGDTWTAEGSEAEDFSRLLGVAQPLMVPFTAHYKYLGVTEDSVSPALSVIYAERALHYENPQGDDDTGGLLPSLVEGLSRVMIYWDGERGEINHYTEDFTLDIKTLYDESYSFRGTTKGQSQSPDTTDVTSVQDTIADMGLENVTVKRSAQGLTISMERIQFLAESTMLQESEKLKLLKIADIISPYSNDILVTGHCAKSGPVSEQQQISEGRARSVANYLIEIGARDSDHIFTQGKGATEAIATNDTAEGRAMNRRVEITLMD